MIVVSGTLTAGGKLEQLSVKKPPDPRVDAAVTEALSNWTFQPAQIGGNAVALKILFGIRLNAR
jgi:TonB family protein